MSSSGENILVIQGPNLNMLGIREPQIYGHMTLAELNRLIEAEARKLQLLVEIQQSNHEGVIIDLIHGAYGQKAGIIINPGAFTHYSYAIADALAAVNLPTIEVHLSDIKKREAFRRHSVIEQVSAAQICGLGSDSYVVALKELAAILRRKND
ncbi:MAG: type II 3-dehydroquinate dehydratase [Bacillota bacterium]|jgi:3-dehydroquinate dehydratase-2